MTKRNVVVDEAAKKRWRKPELEGLSVEELVDLAELKVAFANTNSSGDVGP